MSQALVEDEAGAGAGSDGSETVRALAGRLRARIGADKVLTDPAQLRTYECDGLATVRARPGIVVLAGHRDDVVETVRLCHEAAHELGERKARTVLATGAQIMVTANPGCWMQVATTLAGMGERLPVAHTVQILDASIRGVPVEQLLARALDGPGTVMNSTGPTNAARSRSRVVSPTSPTS